MDWTAFYNQVYDILAQHAGAHENYRDFFVEASLKEECPLVEWRFCGTLGFGGKVWRNNGKMYVSCYSEDSTPEREATIAKVNTLLNAILPSEGVHGPPGKHEAYVSFIRSAFISEPPQA